jgi:hypothetical protein
MQGTATTLDEVALADARDLRRLLLQIGPGVIVATALAAGVGLWGVWMRPVAHVVAPEILAARPAAPAAPAAPPSPGAKVAADPFGELVNPDPYGGLIADRRFFAAAGPPVSVGADPALQASAEAVSPSPEATAPTSEAVPLPPSRDADQGGQTDQATPLPPQRPIEFSAIPAPSAPNRTASIPAPTEPAPAAAPDNRNIFEKLFGAGRPAGVAVASQPPAGRGGSANPGLLAALFGSSNPPAGYDKWTAVYDISARTVYMPDGTKLEAHSGLGDRLDDPRFVGERMRGATPPHLYELQPREASFHGVQALRLIPVGGGDLFGRAGLLAHSYMLGPHGDSNGCVSFKDYDVFLRAYQNGQVKRLAVVARAS